MSENDIFEPYEKLIEIEICGNRVQVPENNTLLRSFQFLSLDTVSLGDFCWNGTCNNCQIWLEVKTVTGQVNEKPALACRTRTQENMKIVRLSDEIKLSDD